MKSKQRRNKKQLTDMASHLNIALFSVLIVVVSLFAGSGFSGIITGHATGIANVTVNTETTLTMLSNNISFGSHAVGATNTTEDNLPLPFVVRNDGNVAINITIGATDLWNTTANPNVYFSAKCGNRTTEWNCTHARATLVSRNWTDGVDGNLTYFGHIPPTANAVKIISNLSYESAQDEAEIEINITVPTDEPAGTKSSTITLTASSCACPAPV